VEVIWADEEAPQEVYTECLLRTMTTEGRVMVTPTQFELESLPASGLREREECDETISRSAWSGGVDSHPSQSAKLEIPAGSMMPLGLAARGAMSSAMRSLG
jgi:hypothetical protein